jgi:lipoprotein NlpI
VHRADGDVDAAIADFDEALKIDPSASDVYLDRALAWESRNELAKAVADLGDAIRVNPTDEELFVARGRLWERQRDFTRAIADYDEAIRLNPKAAGAYNNRCNTWLQKEAYGQALADCNEAVKLNPDLALAHFNRGVVMEITGDLAGAIGEFGETIRLNPQFGPAYKSRGALNFDAGHFDLAKADYDTAARLLPADPYVLLWRYLAGARSDRAAAGSQLEQDAAQVRAGTWPSPVIALMLGHGEAGAVFQSAQQADARVQVDQQCEASFYVGQWHLLQGQKSQAIRLLEDAERNCRRTFAESTGARAELDRLNR